MGPGDSLCDLKNACENWGRTLRSGDVLRDLEIACVT